MQAAADDILSWVISVFPCRQGELLKHNLSAGVILANQSLVLQRVGRHSSGHYTCAASNALGTATSKPLTLNVKCE